MTMRVMLIYSMAVFAMTFFFEWIFHGMFLTHAYQGTASLWRSGADTQSMFGINLLRQLLQSTVIAWLYLRLVYNPGMLQGWRFGLGIGLLMGILQFGSYVYLPIPMSLALLWLAGGVLLGLSIGLVLGVLSNSEAIA